MEEKSRISFQLPCYPAYTKLARMVVAQIANIEGFSKQEEFQIQLAVDEACTNIVNCFADSPDKLKAQMFIEISLLPGGLEINIMDNGCGFDPKSVNPPVTGEYDDLTVERGRGIYIMSNLMDLFQIDSQIDKGTRVKLVKYKKGRVS